MANERRIDEKVIRSFRAETIITVIGFVLVVVGYMLELRHYGGLHMVMGRGEY